MSSIYNSNYINSTDEKQLLEIVEGRRKYDLNPNKIENKHIYVVLEHYLIKYIERNGENEHSKQLLKKYYDDFINYPNLFCDSPLIKNSFLEKFINETSRNKIKDYRDKYYDSTQIKSIFEKLKHQELTDKEKDRLYSYLLTQITNSSYKNIINYCAQKIVNSGKKVNELNDTELKFYCTYVAQIAGADFKVLPQVHISKMSPNEGGYQNNYLIMINKDSNYQNIEDLTHIVCHETRHSIQKKSSIEEENKTALEYTVRELFGKYLSTDEYNAYKVNYNYSDIELDAEKYGYFKAQVILGMLNRRDLAGNLLNQKKKELEKRNYYKLMIGENKNIMSEDKFVVEYTDRIIKEHKEELKEYKVLNSIYNEDGSKKSFGEIITRRMRQHLENRGIYDNYVNYGISHDMLQTLDLDNKNISTKQELFKALSSIYRDKALLLKDYCKDEDIDKYNEKHITNSTIYELTIIDKIITYITDNIDNLMETKEDKLTNRSYIYDFIYDFRDFKIENINNEVIKNNPIIQNKIDEILNKTKKVTYNFNKHYIKDRIKDISDDKLNSTIVSLEGYSIGFKEYLYDDLLPRMDSHMEVDINGKKIYIGDIIKHYRQDIDKKIDNTK